MFQMPREALPGGGGGDQGDRDYSESEEEEEEEVPMSGVEKAQLVLAAQREAWKEQEEYHKVMLEKVMPPPEILLEVALEGVSLDVTSEVPGKTFFSRSRKITRTILKDINISVHPGELLAIMG
jgi:ABC-type ATPase with predicted acetyltransferase domain